MVLELFLLFRESALVAVNTSGLAFLVCEQDLDNMAENIYTIDAFAPVSPLSLSSKNSGI